MNPNYQRRAFFKKTAIVAATLVVTPYFVNSIGLSEPSKGKLSGGKQTDNQPRINQAIQVYCFKDGRVELRTPGKSEVKVSHLYEAGFEVDVLLLIACNKTIDAHLKEIATRHSLSEAACKNRADKLLSDLNMKELICYDNSAIANNTGALYA
jgi:hypothetical protein